MKDFCGIEVADTRGVALTRCPFFLAHILQNSIKMHRFVSGLCLCFVLGFCFFLHGHFAQSQIVRWERIANEVRIALMQKENSLIMIPAFYRKCCFDQVHLKKKKNTHRILNAGIMQIMIHVWQHSCIGNPKAMSRVFVFVFCFFP